MPAAPARFHLPVSVSVTVLQQTLAAAFEVRTEPTVPLRRCYADTFDWRLYAAGSVLVHDTTGRRDEIRWMNRAERWTRRVVPGIPLPRFAADWQDERLREAMQPLLELRALLPIAEVTARLHALRLGDDGKTVVRLHLIEAAEAHDPASGRRAALPSHLLLLPVRGYPQAFHTARQILQDAFTPPPLPEALLDLALDALGRRPLDYVPKPDLHLSPEERAGEATRRVLRALFGTIEANEPGLRADLDTEFLHDFRVAVRRTRSVLSQLNHVFSDPRLDRFQEDFRWLGQTTSPTRDLDVYLLRFSEYQSWLLAAARDDLLPLRAFLQRQQREEHARLVAALGTPRYRSLLGDWRAFLTEPITDPPPDGQRPIRAVVSARIWKLYKKAVRQGRAILDNPEAPDAALHRLRITCKKLRYLLELFGRLYPAQPLAKLVTTLKRLQDVLGDHQDFVVQQAQIQQFARQMVAEGPVPAETLLAMGRLGAHMTRSQADARAAFAEQFRSFARKKTRRRVRTLFKEAKPIEESI